MRILLFAMQAYAVLYGLFAALLALVGSFADGGDAPLRLLVTLAHPISAVGLLAAVFVPTVGKHVIGLAAAILLATGLGDTYVAVLIAKGDIKGDWQIPAIFAATAGIGFLVALAQWRTPTPSADGG
ncbi:MAG: hypothetical protein OXN15_00915 [Chloroflexota bacterium]|nr:hypothetical protein [Chloroflexota bacterium]MDE2969410.1 hypothetical protein [Chloroflexota bacterium]